MCKHWFFYANQILNVKFSSNVTKLLSESFFNVNKFIYLLDNLSQSVVTQL